MAADFGAFFELEGEKTTRDSDEGPAEGEEGRGSQGVSSKWGKKGGLWVTKKRSGKPERLRGAMRLG
ncbi:MAG: hypothetical protein CMO60_08950 [Verrucomicrobiales bacterium]|nr:hypothetical protein [Verrucomicrobiales bacterium]